jgi:hypothetical protein
MPAPLLLIIVALLLIPQQTSAETLGKWIKGAAFPEPSEELVGVSEAGKFLVFAGLGPGWIPQGLVYEYDPTGISGPRSRPWRCPLTMWRLQNWMEAVRVRWIRFT